eukprot:9271450-Alexandrium_andersonii.AAC.1
MALAIADRGASGWLAVPRFGLELHGHALAELLDFVPHASQRADAERTPTHTLRHLHLRADSAPTGYGS